MTAQQLPLITRLSHIRDDWHRRYVTTKWRGYFYEFLAFGVKQAWACLFGGLFLAILLLTFWLYPEEAWLGRFDFLVIIAIAIQATLIMFKLETWEEVRIILIFHIVGTIMEIFKTHMGSWAYPEEGILRLWGVPLFSGFMYAAVGSYIARVWRIFEFRFTRFPPLWVQGVLAIMIYANFFTHHFAIDIRNVLFVFAIVIYTPCFVNFRSDEVHRKMPLSFGLLLVALFIWFAENIATFARAWVYPDQAEGWQMVSISKLGAWYLLMIISFFLVAIIHSDKTTAK